MKQQIFLRHSIKSQSLKEQDFYELCLFQSSHLDRPMYIVEKVHGEWSEIDKSYMFSTIIHLIIQAYEEAEAQYQLLQLKVIAEGYIVPEADFFVCD